VRCPFCKGNKDRVVDSRTGEGGNVIRRRRKCELCRKRFTTYERIEDAIKLLVVKKDGRREPYDRAKIAAGVERACTKLDVGPEDLQRLVDDVEEEVFANYDREVPSKFIGERVAEKLRRMHPVAYVRFVSVFREFRDLSEFVDEAQTARAAGIDPPGQQKLFEPIPRLTRADDEPEGEGEPEPQPASENGRPVKGRAE
jgi:transcriptional repressor NrdR